MKVQYSPREGVRFEIEGATQKDIFMSLAQTDEVFGESNCGQCKGTNLFFKIRNSTAKKGKNKGKTFMYFEVACRSCGAYLPIGQHHNDAGTLFPDRKILNENDEPVYDKEHKGWRKPGLRVEEEDND